MKTGALLVSIFVLVGTLGFLGYKHVNLQGNLKETDEKMQELQENLNNSQTLINELGDNLTRTENKLSQVRENLENTENRLTKVKTELQSLKEGNFYELHNPTYQEVQNFIQEDETNENEYKKEEYVCADYASDVNNNAESEGIRCGTVDIRFEDSAHVIIAFETTDKGLIYVEPQYDIIFPELQAGQEYYKVLDTYYTEGQITGPPSDTIQRMIISW